MCSAINSVPGCRKLKSVFRLKAVPWDQCSGVSCYLMDGAAREVQQVARLQDDIQDGLADVFVSEVWAGLQREGLVNVSAEEAMEQWI